MARYFSKLFGAKEPLFTTELRSLERRSGARGVDVAYIADIMTRAHAVMRRLGLDPADTTGLELYKTLGAHIDAENIFHDTNDVYAIIGDGIVSFNRQDVQDNATLPYELRRHDGVRRAVASELVVRYEKCGVSREVIKKSLALAGVSEPTQLQPKPQKKNTVSTPYILCIGDIFSDVFIKLNENEARIDTDDDGSKRLSLPFGSKPPYDRVDTVTSVGPSPNAAVSCARLGLRVGLMSWLGKDKTSQDSLSYLAHEKIDTTPLVIQKDQVSNIYYVLRYGADRTILVKNENYAYKWIPPKTRPDWIYLSLVSADSWRLHQDLIDYLQENPDIKLAFQPGTFHFKWGVKKLARIYKRSEIVVMNREEAVDVTGKSYDSLQELAQGLHELGPKYVVITDGPNGSYASYDGGLYQIPNYPDPAPPLDRTGAGDAFASTTVAALALGETIQTALTWAPINSMNVVQKLGAQAGLLNKESIQAYLKDAPKNYTLTEIKQ